ncbi:MAG: DUF3572 domain-containing protein [bacterium]|nr:DUF3572 domain-containing protein [bacterium]
MICLLKNKDKGAASKERSTNAQTIALQCLAFLIGQDGARNLFLSTSGLSIDDLRNKATQPDFLAGVMDFLLSDEELIQTFCIESNLTAERVWKARRALPAPPVES